MKKILFIIIALLLAASCTALVMALTKGHQHEITKVDEVQATCTAQGTEAHYFCSGCGKYFADEKAETEIKAPEVIEALGHDYTAWTAVEGTDNHKKTCSTCDDEQIKAHAWVEVDRVNPTHTSEGKANYICSACSVTKEETLDKTPSHSYGAWEKVDDNNHKQTCECGDTVTAPHAWNAGEVTTPATHTTAGVKTFTCTDCGATKTDTIPAITEHVYDQENTELEGAFKSAADCENAAVYYKSCVCGAISNTETFVSGSSLGHDYESIVTAPTCTNKGYAIYTCNNNSEHTYTEEIDIDPTAHTDTSPKDYVCDDCLEIIVDENAIKESYSFTVDKNNPFSQASGGFADGLVVTHHATNGIYYENTYGKTFKVKIYVEEATVVDFYMLVMARWPNVNTDNTVDSILLDGETYGVKRISSVITAASPTDNGTGAWKTSNAKKIHYATIALHAGENEITIVRNSETGQDRNINIAGIAVDSAIDVSLCSKSYDFTVKDNDPFGVENGGSVVDNNTTDTFVPKKATHKTYGTYYEQTYGATFTVNVCVEKATVIDFYFILNNTKEDFTVAQTFDTIKVNGVDVTSSARVNSSVPKTASWGEADSRTVLVATLSLKEGMNEITFVRNADGNSEGFNNLNIRGIKVVSDIPVSLAKD